MVNTVKLIHETLPALAQLIESFCCSVRRPLSYHAGVMQRPPLVVEGGATSLSPFSFPPCPK